METPRTDHPYLLICGPMASATSTVARLLAPRLERDAHHLAG